VIQNKLLRKFIFENIRNTFLAPPKPANQALTIFNNLSICALSVQISMATFKLLLLTHLQKGEITIKLIIFK
jgi:hypothetical protein